MKRGAIVLCGGNSRRMGRDKATLPFGPELLLQRVVRTLSDIVDRDAIVVVAAPHQVVQGLPDDIRLVRDDRPGRGPMEGLAAGLRAMPDSIEAVYASSCDTPFIHRGFVDALFARLNEHEIAVPFDGVFHHPLAAVYRPSVLPAIVQLLAADELKLRRLFGLVSTLEISTVELQSFDPGLSTLVNLNDPDAYERALKAAFDPCE